jgi:glycosyltransferase involved in cell wall biosynthesis
MSQKLTVIVPIYNEEKYLNRCVDSIVNQSYENLEIILVDNKSTDSTGSICDTYGAKDSRIKVIHRKEHGWISDGRNDGLAAATGEWITFVDADDWLELNFYQEMFDHMPQNSDTIDILFSGGRTDYCNDGSIKKVKYRNTDFDFSDKEKIIGLIGELLDTPVTSNVNSTLSAVWDKLYRADFIKKNNLYFPTDILFLDDIYYNLAAFEKSTRIAGIDYVGYNYWFNPNSVTHAYKPDVDKKARYDIKKMKQNLEEEEIYNGVKDRFNSRVILCVILIMELKSFNKKNNSPYILRKQQFKKLMEEDTFHEAVYGSKSKMLFKFRIREFFLKIHFYLPFELYYRILRK